MIQRDSYLNKIIERMWDGNIKVITGLRRCGKSTLLFELFSDYLLSNGADENKIIKIKLDERKYYKFRNPIKLCDYVLDLISKDAESKYYLFIDEVQFTVNVKDKDNDDIEISIYDMLNELRGYKNLDVYVTGSNSKMLSKDIATQFRGRSTQIKVYPFSFKEFYSYRGGTISEAIDEYLLYGGMPGLVNEISIESKRNYLKNLYEEIYIKDLVERGKIQREDVLDFLLDYLSSSVGSLTNPNKITNAINDKLTIKISNDTISKYLNDMIDAFLISEVKRYDVRGKKYFIYPNKYYYSDVGLRNVRLNYRQMDYGFMMENVIYNELVRRGYSVDVGVIEDRRDGSKKIREIDFVVNDFDKKIYIQCSYKMDDDIKINSEVDSLKLTNDFFKKIIIRRDIITSFYDESGIFNCSLEDFLLDKVELF